MHAAAFPSDAPDVPAARILSTELASCLHNNKRMNRSKASIHTFGQLSDAGLIKCVGLGLQGCPVTPATLQAAAVLTCTQIWNPACDTAFSRNRVDFFCLNETACLTYSADIHLLIMQVACGAG